MTWWAAARRCRPVTRIRPKNSGGMVHCGVQDGQARADGHWWARERRYALRRKRLRACATSVLLVATHRRGVRLIRGERLMTTNNSITLTACEAAKVLGLAPSTLAKLRLSGNGPVYCKLGRRLVYRREDLEGVARIACCTQHLGRRGATAQEPDRATAGLRDRDSHPNPRLVKVHRNYSVEVARLFGLHKSTVRNWVKQRWRTSTTGGPC